jgi:RHS repeat-associated protein
VGVIPSTLHRMLRMHRNRHALKELAKRLTDSDGTVTLVEFFGDGALLGATSTPPFGFTWSNVAAGSHTLTARATDNRNGQTTSAPVSITVNSPPTATLTAPVSGASFNPPATVTLTATASDTDGTIVKVEFYQGAILIGTATAAPYAASWSVLAPGTYTLTAKAYDNLGGTGVSAPVSVTVAGSVTFLHNDFAGNPIAATDANSALLWKENFRPYGDRLNNPAAASGNRQWFHGKPADADTGLSYFGARYYDPTVGRFMGVDQVGFGENLPSFNRYAYGADNPYRYTDPDGRFFQYILRVASIAVRVVGVRAATKWIRDKIQDALRNNADSPNETPAGGAEASSSQNEGATAGANESGPGSYTNTHASGKTYHGKGPRSRADKSAKEKEDKYDDPVKETEWKPAENDREAFKDEARKIRDDGGVKNPNNYNIRNSPGEKYIWQDEPGGGGK